MSGISVGGAPPFLRVEGGGGGGGGGDELRGVLRAALLSAQHLLRERFEKRVAWVDGHWEWRREPLGPAPAPPLPPEARKKVADVSRLFEILTNAQFRDQGPLTKPSSAAAPSFVPFERRLPSPVEAARAEDRSAFLVCTLLLVAAAAVWLGALVLFNRDACRRRVTKIKQRIKGWFTKKAAAAEGEASAEQTPPRDDPPPPYSDASAEPFLSPGGAVGGALSGVGDLPPPYSSCDAPDCKEATSNDQQESLMGAGAVSAAPDVCAAQAEQTDDEDCSKPDSSKVFCDSSLVVVV
ncbi:uncharacterized protein [Choristoneura fumiferana]|uniref:uncharacterized protein n=1 Tax=Choristoneura fumiferana TaxID=7141 RepID=UPI003D156A6D